MDYSKYTDQELKIFYNDLETLNHTGCLPMDSELRLTVSDIIGQEAGVLEMTLIGGQFMLEAARRYFDQEGIKNESL